MAIAAEMTGKERLNRLADFLEKEVQPVIDGVGFDMGVWNVARSSDFAEHDRMAKLIGERVSLEKALPDLRTCGFEGCAIGWAVFCPDLDVPTTDKTDPWYRWSDIQDYFGLSYDQVLYLFSPDHYDDESDLPTVVARIRGVAETGSIPSVAVRTREDWW